MAHTTAFEFSYTFNRDLHPVTVQLAARYDAGQAERLGGRPEDYDPGEPSSTTFETVSVDGGEMSYEDFAELLRSLVGDDADVQLEAAERAATAHYELTHPAPDYDDVWSSEDDQ